MSDHTKADELFRMMHARDVEYGSKEYEARRVAWRAELYRTGELGECKGCHMETSGAQTCEACRKEAMA